MGDNLKKTALLLVMFLIPLASGFQVNEVEITQEGQPYQGVIFNDSEFDVRLNVTDIYNYTFRIVNQSVLKQEEMQFDRNTTANNSIYRASLNASGMSTGSLRLQIQADFDGDTEIFDQDAFIVGDKPVITGLEYRDSLNIGEENYIRAWVADSDDSELDGAIARNESAPLNFMDDLGGDRVQNFGYNLSADNQGFQEYIVSLTDSSGNFGIEEFGFRVEDTVTDETTVNVSVDYSCSIFLRDYKLPGNGTIEYNTTGNFNKTVENRGQLRANLTFPYLNISQEGSTPYSSDPKGDIVKSYGNSTVDFFQTGQSASYYREFKATYDPGYYAAHSSFEWSCDNNGARVNHSVSLSRNFRILNVTQQGGSEEGETSEGDNDQPGQTEVEVPEPEPEPVIQPTPMLSIDVEPREPEFNGSRGNFIPVDLNISNEATEESVTDLTVVPQINQRQGWEVRQSSITELEAGQTVNREVFIRPSEDAQTGYYIIPVTATSSEQRLDIDYINLKVTEQTGETRIAITESPASLTVDQGDRRQLPVLVRNTGEETLNNVSAEVQNAEQCGIYQSGTVQSLGPNETGSVNLVFNSSDSLAECQATVIVSSAERAYAFSDVNLDVTDTGIVRPEQRPPIIAIGWTLMLIAYALVRKRLDLDTAAVNVPLIILIIGEVVIAVYLAADAGIIQSEILPF